MVLYIENPKKKKKKERKKERKKTLKIPPENDKNSSIKLVKLQDTKLMYCFRFRFRNLLNFYKLTTNYQKKKLSNQSYLPIASISSKRIRHLGINLSKEAKDLYSKNYKTLMKDIEDGTDEMIYHVLGLKESILSK